MYMDKKKNQQKGLENSLRLFFAWMVRNTENNTEKYREYRENSRYDIFGIFMIL